MENVKAIVLSNTVVSGNEVSNETFLKAQNEVNEPMVIFMEKETHEVKGVFKIVADTAEELEFMYDNKVFYSSSVEIGEYKKCFGAVFVGVDPDYKKEKSAQLQLNA